MANPIQSLSSTSETLYHYFFSLNYLSGTTGIATGAYPFNGKTLLPPLKSGHWNGIIPSGTPFKITAYKASNPTVTQDGNHVNFAIYDAQISEILNTKNTDPFLTGTLSGQRLVSRFTNPFLNGKITSDQILLTGIDPAYEPIIHHNLSLQNIEDKKRIIVNNILPLFYNQ